MADEIIGITHCPNCREGKIIPQGEPYFVQDNRRHVSYRKCLDCHATWKAVFRYVSYEKLNVPAHKPDPHDHTASIANTGAIYDR